MTGTHSLQRPRARVVLAIVIGTPLAVFLVWTVMAWIDHASKPVFQPPPPRHPVRLVVEPATIDFGRRSQCDGLIRVKGTLRNASNEPAELQDWLPSCGCTSPTGRMTKGMIFAPGEGVDFEITSDAWAHSGPKSFHIDFLERNADAPVRFTIKYIVESPLYTDTGYLIRMVDGPSLLKVSSRDKRPFRILSVEPAIVADLDTSTEAEEHQLTIDWAMADEALGPEWRESELLIKTDRDDCPMLHLRLQGSTVLGTPDAVPATVPAPSTEPVKAPVAAAAPE